MDKSSVLEPDSSKNNNIVIKQNNYMNYTLYFIK